MAEDRQGGEALRSRAAEMSRRASELGEKVGELEGELRAARQSLGQAERRHELEVELMRAGAVDVETARILAEREEGEAASCVKRLRRDKPFLFRAKPATSAGASMAARGGGGESELSRSRSAAERGDRGALLRYMRARRGG